MNLLFLHSRGLKPSVKQKNCWSVCPALILLHPQTNRLLSTDNFSAAEKLVSDLHKYVELRLEYYRISGMEKAASTTSFILLAVIVILLLFFTFLFANIFVAVLIAHAFESLPLGFGIFAGSYLLFTLLIVLFWKRIKRFIDHRFFAFILESIEEQEDHD